MSSRIKEYFIFLAIMIIGMLAFNYFVGSKLGKKPQSTQEVHSGERLAIPSSVTQLMPLQKEIDFFDAKSTRPTVYETIEAPKATYRFSNDGATLDTFEFKHQANSKLHELVTISPPGQMVKEDRCFLVALNQKTPYYFTLTSRNDTEEKTVLTYRAEFDDGVVVKRFTVYQKNFKVDVALTLEPRSGKKMQARIVVPSPDVSSLKKDDKISLVVNKLGADSIERVAQTQGMFDSAWIAPTLFGLEDKYFVHGMVADPHSFAQRGYVKQWEGSGLIAFLEGPVVTEKKSWNLSFYIGPKEVTAMSAVDERLTQVLDYGWFDAIARWLLYILRWIASFTHSYGLAIIILTLLIRLLMAPFMSRSMASIKKQQEMSKKSRYIEKKYKNDPERLRQERAELFKKHGMPGASGCLPILLQIPVFMALYRVLAVSLELYQAPFLWMPDLSAKDPYFIMPLLTGVSIILSSPTTDAKQFIMMGLVGLVMSAFMSSLSSGLLLYMFVTTAFSVVQNLMQKRTRKS